MPPPSLLLVVTQSDLGGAQRAVLTIARATMLSGWQTTVAAGADPSTPLGAGGALGAACAREGIPFRALRHLRREIRPLADLRSCRELRRLIRDLRPTIVHAHSSKAGFLTTAALVAMRGRPKHVYTAHGWVFLEPGRTRLYRLLERIAARGRDATIVLSPQEREAARAARVVGRGPLRVIPNGVSPVAHDRPAARDALTALGVPRDAVLVGCVAHFYPTKNIPALVTAFAAAPAGAHLVLVGDGIERPAVEAAARTLPGRIQVLGARPDARALMDGFDLFVLPSVKEGLPFALLEAMEAGLPCLATAVGGVASVIADGMNGWLTAPDALTDGLRRVFAARASWPRIGAAARETVRTLFSEERMTTETMRLYRDLTESLPDRQAGPARKA